MTTNNEAEQIRREISEVKAQLDAVTKFSGEMAEKVTELELRLSRLESVLARILEVLSNEKNGN